MGIFQQFPYTNFHEMNLDQIIKIMREMQDEWESTKAEWASYKDFIDNYFANLNLDAETEKALRRMLADGTLDSVIAPVIASEVTAWLADHITQPTTPAVDDSLTVQGAAADAKATGDAIKTLKSDINSGIITGTRNLSSADFEQGFYATFNQLSNVNDALHTKRIRNKMPLKVNAGDTITYSVAAGTRISFKTETYASPAWITTDGSLTLPVDSYVEINVSNVDDSVIAPADYAEVIVVPSYANANVIDEQVNNGFFNEYIILSDSDFINGYWLPSSRFITNDSFYTKRIGSIDFYKVKSGTKIIYKIPYGFNAAFKLFGKEPNAVTQQALSESAWLAGAGVWTVGANGYVVINMRKVNDDTLTPADVSGQMFGVNNETIFDFFNDLSKYTSVGSSPYYGEKISLEPYTFDVTLFGSVAVAGRTPQGACIYGDKLFQMYAWSKFAVYDIPNKTLSNLFSFDAASANLHCNSACFGNKQNVSDDYPLLYVNAYLDDEPGICEVHKIIQNNDQYTTQLIQTIKIGFVNDTIWTGDELNPSTFNNGNFLVDINRNKLYAYTTQGFSRTRFFIFDLPAVGSDVILTTDDIVDYFDIAYVANIQDACIHNDMIYMTSGIDYGQYDQILRLYAINIDGRSIVSEVHLDEVAALSTEPEGVDYYNNSLIVTLVNGALNQLKF